MADGTLRRAALMACALALVTAPVASAGTVSVSSRTSSLYAEADGLAGGMGAECGATANDVADEKSASSMTPLGSFGNSFSVADTESTSVCGGSSGSANGSVNTSQNVAVTDGSLSMSSSTSASGHIEKREPAGTTAPRVWAGATLYLTSALVVSFEVSGGAVALHCTRNASEDLDASDGTTASVFMTVDGEEVMGAGTDVVLQNGFHDIHMEFVGSGITDETPDVLSSSLAGSLSASCNTVPQNAVAITSGPSGATGSTSASFEFIALSPSPPPGRFECRVDDGALTPCVSPVSFSNLAQGQHTFEVLYHPDGEVPGPPVGRTWTVDTVAPTVTFDSAPAGERNAAEATIAFHADEDATFLCSLDDAIPAACSSPVRLTALANGPHHFTVLGRDAAGNEGPAATVTWSVQAGSILPAVATCASGGTTRVEDGPFVLVARERPEACFTTQGTTHTSVGPVTWNGLLIRPQSGSQITLSRDGTQAVVAISGPSALDLGPAGTWALPSRLRYSASMNAGVTQAFKLLDALQGEPEDTAFSIGSLPLAISPTFEMSDADGGKTAVGIKLALPTKVLATHEFLPGLGEPDRTQGLSAEFTASASNDDGFSFAGKATVAEAWLLGLLKFEDVSIGFDSGGPSFEAGGSMSFGQPVSNRQRKATAEIALGPDGFFGALRKFSLGVSKLNVPIGTTPFYLQDVAGSAARDDSGIKVTGKLGISGGPTLPVIGEALSLKGTLSLKLPERGTWSLTGTGEGQIAEVPVAQSTYAYIHGERLTYTGKLDLSIAGYGALAEITDSWFTTTDFNVEGRGTLSLPILGSDTAEAVVSKTGYAVCFGQGGARLGIGKRWGQEPQLFGSLCDLGPFRSVASAAQDQRTFTVPRGRRLFAIQVRGSTGSAPAVTLVGPGVSLNGPVKNAAALVVPDDHRGVTTIVLRRPRPGTYRLATTGSVRTAVERPPASLRGRVSGRGAKRTLSWNLRAQPGQRVTFVETGSAGAKVITTTARRRGHLRFTPSPTAGSARRTIVARIVQDGLPRQTATIARYRFARRPGPVTKIRRSGAHLLWRGTARGYTVVLEGPSRAVTTTTVRRSRLTLARALRRARLRVTIYAHDGFGRPGRRTTITLKKL